MRIGKKFIGSAVCMTAFMGFGQNAADIQNKVEQLKKSVDISPATTSDYRDKQKQKMTLMKVATQQDKDMGFDGVMRVTVELTGNNGEVWYGQIMEPQSAKKADYSGVDYWRFRFPQGDLKYPKMAYAIEYGFLTNGTFVAVDQQFEKVDSADEIMKRNKDSKNKLEIVSRKLSDQEGAAGGGAEGEDGGAEGDE